MSKFALALACLWPCVAVAQSASDKIFVGAQQFGTSELNERPGEAQQRGIIVQANSPAIFLAPTTLLRFGAGYRRLTVDLDQGAALLGEPAVRHLTAIDVGVSLTHIVSAQWALTAGFAPAVRSDFSRDFSGKDLQWGGFALASYTYGPRYQHTFSFGLAARTRATLFPVLPIAAYSYRGETFFFEGTSNGVSALWRFDRVEAGLFFSFDDAFYNVAPANDPRLVTGTFLRASNMTAGPLLNVRVAGPLWIETRAGYGFLRFLRYNNEDLDRVDRGINMDPNGALMVQVGVGYGERKTR